MAIHFALSATWLAIPALSALLLAGCAVGPDFHRPSAPAVNRFPEAPLPAPNPQAAQNFAPGEQLPVLWWTQFESPALNALVTQALRNNPSLAAQTALLREARETTRAATGALFPTITAQANRTTQRVSAAESGISPGQAQGLSDTFAVYDAQVNVSYTFDVWGQTRRTIEADQQAAAQQRFLREGAADMLAGNVVTAAVTAASLTAQIEAEQRLLDAEDHILKTVRTQFELGGATGTDVATQETQRANTAALIVPLQTQVQQTRDRLAAYLGQAPAEAALPSITLADFTLPARVPVSLPSSLVEQRPDIRAAEAQLHQATAAIGVAIANRLPQLTISGFIGTAPAHAGQAFTPGNGIYSLLTQAMAPIFEGGTLLHQQRAAVAAAQAAAATYRATVINAFQNVADVLTALQNDALALTVNEQAEHAAARSLRLAQVQYDAGGAAYLSVLTAQTQYQSAVLALIRAHAAQLTDTAALYVALGSPSLQEHTFQ